MKDLKLILIVGGPKCPTKRLSNFLDLILKPLTKHVKSNIKNNIELLKTSKRNTVLVTFDVRSLYTNISHELGLRAIEYFVSYYRQIINPRFTIQFILEAASFILRKNSMTFDEVLYLQMQRTTMGTIFASTYATLSIDYHEIELCAIIGNKFSLPVSQYVEQN